MNNIHIGGHPPINEVGPQFEAQYPHTVVMGWGQVMSYALWKGASDALATAVACGVGFGGTLLAREACRHVPPLHMLFSGATALACAITSYVFASGTGTEGWHPKRKWIGYAAAGAGAALTLYTTYHERDLEAWTKKAVGFFGTAVYSLAREYLQNEQRRAFPELRLDPQKAPRWERGGSTCQHLKRVALACGIYAVSSVLLNGLARQNVVSPDFGGLNQALTSFSWDSLLAFTLRTVNEGLDGFTSTLLLAAFFRADLQPGHGYCSNQHDNLSVASLRGSSRVSMNLFVNSVQALIPTHVCTFLLQGLTGARGAVQGAKQPTTENVLDQAHLDISLENELNLLNLNSGQTESNLNDRRQNGTTFNRTPTQDDRQRHQSFSQHGEEAHKKNQ